MYSLFQQLLQPISELAQVVGLDLQALPLSAVYALKIQHSTSKHSKKLQ